MSEQQPEPDVTEAIKLGFETLKQLTTLNAGSIVVIGTFLSNIFPTDKQGTLTVPLYTKILIGLAFVGFGASLLFSTFGMIIYRGILESRLHTGQLPPKLPFGNASESSLSGQERSTIFLPTALFTGGLLCFGAAVLLNLFFGS